MSSLITMVLAPLAVGLSQEPPQSLARDWGQTSVEVLSLAKGTFPTFINRNVPKYKLEVRVINRSARAINIQRYFGEVRLVMDDYSMTSALMADPNPSTYSGIPVTWEEGRYVVAKRSTMLEAASAVTFTYVCEYPSGSGKPLRCEFIRWSTERKDYDVELKLPLPKP